MDKLRCVRNRLAPPIRANSNRRCDSNLIQPNTEESGAALVKVSLRLGLSDFGIDQLSQAVINVVSA